MITSITSDQNYTSNLSTPNPSSSSSGFDLTQFESELTALVNQCLQNAGVSSSQASFSFAPSQNSASPAATAQASTSAEQPATTAPSASSVTAAPSQNTVATSTEQPVIAAGLHPGIDTNGPDAPCIYDIHNDRFWNDGNTAGDRFMIDPIQGKPVDYDAIVRGLEQVYGADNHAQVGHAMTMRFGDSFLQQYELDHPGQYNAIMDTKPLTNFELYGAYGSFTDTDGLSHYYDEKGVEHLSRSAANDAFLAKQATSQKTTAA
jgi:hypothetical protein